MLEPHVYEILVEVQEPSGGQTEGMRRGLSKNTQQRLRVFPSKMEPYEAHVAICSPCTWPWCHEGGKATWKEGMETLEAGARFLHSFVPVPPTIPPSQKLEEQPNKRCFTCFSQKTLVEMCVQVPAGKVTWDRLAWLPTGVHVEMEDVDWNRIERRVSPKALREGVYFCCYWNQE